MIRDRSLAVMGVAFVAVLLAGKIAPDWFRFLLQSSLATTLVVLGVMLQMRAGLVSFGQGLFYCLGGYAAGMAGYFWGITDVFALLALGGGVAAFAGFFLGFLLARYREIFFAMLSLAFSMILYGVLVKAEALGSTDGFNVPPSTFLGYAPEGEALHFSVYVLTCSVSFVVAMALHRYLGSTFGLVGDAIRQNEIRVEYLGASVRRVVHGKYVLAAAVSGLGGVLTAVSVGHVDPGLSYWTTSGEFVFVALVSGTGHVAAPFIGAFLLEMLRTYAFEYAPYTWQMVLGGAMLAVILFLPGGLWSLARPRKAGGAP